MSVFSISSLCKSHQHINHALYATNVSPMDEARISGKVILVDEMPGKKRKTRA
jgi:hypothetical protein